MLHNKEHNCWAAPKYALCKPCMTTSQWSTRQAYSKGKALRNQYVLHMHFHSLSLSRTQTLPLTAKPIFCTSVLIETKPVSRPTDLRVSEIQLKSNNNRLTKVIVQTLAAWHHISKIKHSSHGKYFYFYKKGKSHVHLKIQLLVLLCTMQLVSAFLCGRTIQMFAV